MPTPHKCPVCEGTGKLADLYCTASERQCHACHGSGILWPHYDHPPSTPMDWDINKPTLYKTSIQPL